MLKIWGKGLRWIVEVENELSSVKCYPVKYEIPSVNLLDEKKCINYGRIIIVRKEIIVCIKEEVEYVIPRDNCVKCGGNN